MLRVSNLSQKAPESCGNKLTPKSKHNIFQLGAFHHNSFGIAQFCFSSETPAS
jgi:hypothetical protein